MNSEDAGRKQENRDDSRPLWEWRPHGSEQWTERHKTLNEWKLRLPADRARMLDQLQYLPVHDGSLRHLHWDFESRAVRIEFENMPWGGDYDPDTEDFVGEGYDDNVNTIFEVLYSGVHWMTIHSPEETYFHSDNEMDRGQWDRSPRDTFVHRILFFHGRVFAVEFESCKIFKRSVPCEDD